MKGLRCNKTGKIVKFEDCLKCNDRCFPLTLLKHLFKVRDIDIKNLHVTQLLTPAWQLYLLSKNEHIEDVYSLFYATYGSAQHSLFETFKDDKDFENDLIEKDISMQFDKANIVGRIDYYSASDKILWDYKTFGTYKVKLLLEEGPDDKLLYQLNIYRFILKYSENIKVDKMKVLILVRDWRISEFKKYGDVNNTVVIDIPKIDDYEVEKFIIEKIDSIHRTFKTGKGYCTDEETWNGRRCKDYCPVKDLCDKYKDVGSILDMYNL